MEFGPFLPDKNTSKEVIEQLGDDLKVEEYRVMCLEAGVF